MEVWRCECVDVASVDTIHESYLRNRIYGIVFTEATSTFQHSFNDLFRNSNRCIFLNPAGYLVGRTFFDTTLENIRTGWHVLRVPID